MPAYYASLKRDDLYTTDDDFESVWEVLGKARDGTETIRVPREALLHVMMDHSLFHAQVFPYVPSPQKKPKGGRNINVKLRT